MIRDFKKVNKSKLNLIKIVSVYAFLILVSCSDNGCIDANDFGDYESASIRVYANPKGEGCEFGDLNKAKDILDSGNYGSMLKQCITDSSCAKKEEIEELTPCINGCINKCVNDGLIYNIPWKNIGNMGSVVLEKDAEIYIKAIGNVNFGSNAQIDPIHLSNLSFQSQYLIPFGQIEELTLSNISTSPSKIDANSNHDIIDNIIASSHSCVPVNNIHEKFSYFSKFYLNSICVGKDECSVLSELIYHDQVGDLQKCSANDKESVSLLLSRQPSRYYFLNKESNFIVRISGKYEISQNETDLLYSNIIEDSILSETPNVVNGVRRIVAYIQPVPNRYMTDPYYPSSPNPLAWNCKYDYNKNKYICSTDNLPPDSYSIYSPSFINGQLISSSLSGLGVEKYNSELSNFFPVDTSSEDLSINEDKQYGTYGFVRYENDYLKKDAITKNDDYKDDNYYISFNSSGNYSNKEFSFVPKVPSYAYKISLTILNQDLAFGDENVQYDGNCSNSIIGYEIYKNGNLEFQKTYSNPISIKNNEWTQEPITLEKGSTLVVTLSSGIDPSYNCGNRIILRYLKYRDIEVAKSGFVRFSILDANATNSGNLISYDTSLTQDSILNGKKCRIKGRIINPLQSPYSSLNAENSNYYEYENDKDPLNGDSGKEFLVYKTTRNDLTRLPYLKTSAPVFVRKGQIIRFDPISWNGVLNHEYQPLNAGGNITYNQLECGEGLVMITEPRPALFCSSRKTDEKKSNPNCIPETNPNGDVKCTPYSFDCDKLDTGDDATDAKSFCPEKCRISNQQYKQFSSDPQNYDQQFKCTPDQYTPNSSLDYCKKCAEKSDAVSMESPYLQRGGGSNYTQCFDLENFNGSVKNLNRDISSISLKDDLIEYINEKNCINSTDLSCKSQGLSLLNSFNGYYGNLDNFVSAKIIDPTTGSVAIQTSALTSQESGILKFLIVDGDDFNSITENSSSNPYKDNKGDVQISLSSGLNFKNGERLEIAFCDEGDANGVSKCSNIVNPSDPRIISYLNTNKAALPSFTDFSGNVISNYQFDQNGNLFRVSDRETQNYECKSMEANSGFFCYSGNGVVVDQNRARLSFRLKDTEKLDCVIPSIIEDDVEINCIDPSLDDGSGNMSLCNGILAINPGYDASDDDNKGKYCKYSDIKTDTDDKKGCSKEYNCVSSYLNNSGFYDVQVKVKKPEISQLSGFINKIISPVLEVLDSQKLDSKETIRDERLGLGEYIYKSIISDNAFRSIFNMMTILMISFYGLGYFMGVIELKHSDIINRLIKIGIIYLFTSPGSWYWFNTFFVNTFKDGTEYLTFTMASAFDNSTTLKNAITNNYYSDKTPLFYSVDRVLSLILSDTVHKKIIALLFYNFFGFIYLMVIYWSAISYVYAVSNAVLLYLTAHFFTSLLFGIAPIFFIFLMFEKTKNYFDNWLNGLIGFSLQRIFLISTLAMFNFMIYEVIKFTLAYRICWGSVWTIGMGALHVSLLSSWEPHSSPSYLRAAMANDGSIDSGGTPSLPIILSLWALCSLMLKFIPYISELSSSLSSGISSVELGKNISSSISKGIDAINDRASEMWKISGGRLMDRADNYLFQSGSIAKENREMKRKEISQNQKMKKLMSAAGEKAVNEYKRNPNNMIEYGNLSEKEKYEKLMSVRKEAMKEYGKKMGIGDKKLETMMSEKGPRYVGDNVFGFLKAAVSQGNSSLDEKVEGKNTKLDISQIKNAMKNANPEEREKLVEVVKSGKVEIGKEKYFLSSKVERLKDFFVRNGKAENKLVEEGKINKMAIGARFFGARNEKEMRMIREKAMDMKLNKGDDQKVPDKKDVKRVEEIRDKYNKEEEKKKKKILEDGRIGNPRKVEKDKEIGSE